MVLDRANPRRIRTVFHPLIDPFTDITNRAEYLLESLGQAQLQRANRTGKRFGLNQMNHAMSRLS